MLNRCSNVEDVAAYEALVSSGSELKGWLTDNAIPLWSYRGLRSSGLFYELLDLSGQPVESGWLRVRTQARQVFSLALAHRHGWGDAGTAAKVKSSLYALLRTAIRPDGLAGRVIDTRNESLADDTADVYDTAFCLLALAHSRSIVGEDFADAHADRMNEAVARFLGLGVIPAASRLARPAMANHQNPHMHLLESTLALAAARRDQESIRRARLLLAVSMMRFFDARSDVVREEVDDCGGAMSMGYEPGHSMEWVWLFGQAARLFDEPLPDTALRLYEKAARGESALGNTVLQLDDDNSAIDGCARLWSQAESLKAHLCIAEWTGSHTAMERAASVAQSIRDRWLATDVRGGWLDRFDERGQLVATTIPASTLYHLSLAITELLRVAPALSDRTSLP